MNVKKQIVNKKTVIKKLVKQYTNTPSTSDESDWLLGIIAVHREELVQLEGV